MLAACLGYRAIITVPYKTSSEKIGTIRAFGAIVFVSPKAATKDDSEHYVNKAAALAEQYPEAVYLNQYANASHVETHYQQTGVEIWQQMNDQINYLVAAASSGGTLTGVGKYLKERNPAIKIIMPDPVGSVFHHYFQHQNLEVTALPYAIEGAGKDQVCSIHDFSLIDEVIPVTDKDAFNTARRLATIEGILAGGSSGAALFVAEQLSQRLLTATLKDNGLGAIMKNLNIIDVDGDHYSIMENENLKIVAKEINKIGVGRQLRANGIMDPT